MRKVLILFAHPALEKSRVNQRLIEAVRDLPGVTFHDLYQLYPDLDIDVAREQELLVEHDVIVMQHPLFWYSTPAMLKEWQDLVLEHGWAYGHDGTALHGKILLTATTAGGSETAYGCPTFLYPGKLSTNTYCIQCMECVQACPHDNMAVNLRPWGSDLAVEGKPRADEAYLALLMLAITGFHGLTMTPVWQKFVDGIRDVGGFGRILGFSIGMAVW